MPRDQPKSRYVGIQPPAHRGGYQAGIGNTEGGGHGRERSSVPETTTGTGAADRITAALTRRYGLIPQRLIQLPIGQGTINYRGTCTDRDVFVKSHPRRRHPGESIGIP